MTGISSYVHIRKEKDNLFYAYWRGTNNRITVKNGSLIQGFKKSKDLRDFLLLTDTPLENGVLIDLYKYQITKI